MKNIFFLLASVLLFSSCVKDEEVTFEIQAGNSYVLQEEQNGSYLYSPFLFIYTTNMAHPLKSVSINKGDFEIPMIALSEYGWVTNASYDNLDVLNGTFNVNAVSSASGDVVSPTIALSFNEKDILGEIKVESFSYQSDVVTAKIQVPENATGVGFAVNLIQSNTEYMRFNNVFHIAYAQQTYEKTDSSTGKTTTETKTLKDQAAEDGTLTFNMKFDTDSYDYMLGSEYVTIGVMAVSANGVVRIGESKTIKAKDQSF